jgi:hypothetical protein
MAINVTLITRRLAVVGALVMIIGLGVAHAASAATKVPIWTAGGTHLPFGTEVSYGGSAASGLNLKWHQSGLPLWIQCNTLASTGKVENYASGKAGTLKASSAAFRGCKVVEVGEQTYPTTTCSVPSEIPLKVTSGELTNTPYSGGGLKLSNIELDFEIKHCPFFIDELEWRFWGSVTGNEGLGAFQGEVLFPEKTSLAVNAGGTGAEIEFGLDLEGSGSTPIKIGEEEMVVPHNPGHHYWYTGGAMRRGEGARTLVAPGSALAIKGSGNALRFEGTAAGIKTTISCSGGTTTGSVENPSGGGNGTASVGLGLTGCSVIKPEGKSCVVKGGSISTQTLTGSLSAAEVFAPMKLTKSGEWAQVTIEGCTTVEGLNNTFPLSGSLFVSPYLSPTGAWAIQKSQNEGALLKFAGQKAVPSGEVGAESRSGQAVTWTE